MSNYRTGSVGDRGPGMSEPLPDEVVSRSAAQAMATALQILAAWEQRQQRHLLLRQTQLEQQEVEALDQQRHEEQEQAREDQQARDAQEMAREQERIARSWPLIDQVEQAWAEQARHTDLARAWVHAIHAEQAASDPTRRAAAAAAADTIEAELRRRAPATMHHYDAARAQGMARQAAMQPLASSLDTEATTTGRAQSAPAGARAHPGGGAAPPATARTAAAGTRTQAGDTATRQRVYQACRDAAASWGARPFHGAAAAAAAAAEDDAATYTASSTSTAQRSGR